MITAIYSGNLGLGHQLETIVYAVSKLNGEANLRVLFIGNGKGRQPLKKLVRELELEKVEFRPPVPLYRLRDVLAAGDIHFVSQKAGTQGVIVPSKIYGILAAGRPTIFIGPSDCEPAMIVNKSQSGIVVPPEDIEGVAMAIRKLAIDPVLRQIMGKRAQKYYEKNFGRVKSVSRIIKVIETIATPPLPSVE